MGLVDVTRLFPGLTTPPTGHLFLTRDFRTWKEVTPPQVRASPDPLYFMQATFLDPEDGWVSFADADRTTLLIYRTLDGGRDWQAEANGSQGDHAGDKTTIQFVSPQAGYMNTVWATAPRSFLDATNDGGKSWTEISVSNPRTEHSLPPNSDVTFSDSDHAVAVLTLPGCGTPNPALPARVFFSADNGRHWAPSGLTGITIPAGSELCPLRAPSFTTPMDGVLAAELVNSDSARDEFLATTDAGAHFTLVGSLPQTLAPPSSTVPSCPQVLAWPTITIGEDGAWWTAGTLPTGAQVIETSSDRGASWSSATITGLSPCIRTMAALNRSQAWLTTGDGPNELSFVTTDGGRSWAPFDPLRTP